MFRTVQGLQRVDRHASIARHVHRQAYATIVLAGSYCETGDDGRRRIEGGDLVIHTPFNAHADRFGGIRGELYNVPLDDVASFALLGGRVADPEDLVREVERAPHEAAALLATIVATISGTTPGEAELADRLAAELQQGSDRPLAGWASQYGSSDRTLRRQFTMLYEVSAAHYRARSRAREAWRRIAVETTALATIAFDCGFADQAHMSRAVLALTGAPPRAWRRRMAV